MEPPPNPSFEEPGVLDEDIVYDDTDYRFPDPNQKTFQKTELQQILKVIRQKVGLNLDLGEVDGEPHVTGGLVYHGRSPTEPVSVLDTSALPPDVDVLGDMYHIPLSRNLWEPPKTEWIPGPDDFVDIDEDEEESTVEDLDETMQKLPNETDEEKLKLWEKQWENPQIQPAVQLPTFRGKPKISEQDKPQDKTLKLPDKAQKPQDKTDKAPKPQDKTDKAQKPTDKAPKSQDKTQKPPDKAQKPQDKTDKAQKPTDKAQKPPEKTSKPPDKTPKPQEKGKK